MGRRLAKVGQIATPTLMIQGADDRCDEPSGSADQERFFTAGYRRLLLDGVGQFPHREAPDEVALNIDRHLEPTGRDKPAAGRKPPGPEDCAGGTMVCAPRRCRACRRLRR